ncbi:hypothetical protein B5F40_13405 [Gordonibacter sp. An230]|uniref:dimethyl sulfoxide reductase anchor subunit family protein n=1 Tax=Gordonibacter sp. An230 TaxID=1965592 RepID=UPI000B375870|nr:DmsC/YnfH family molybdoenzyme membrane anchor subunit [Gordonibacter sp. An230]OUO87598.1 hypothetical protein B5F40_13405 [Gordonibacter sp. An230]
MEAALNELPLALFTTLAPMGAGAFVALACALFTTTFSDEQLKRIDRFTALPLIVVLAGFVASFFHLANPLHAPMVFAGIGSSPLSNEIVVGCVFLALAVVYWILAVAGKLSSGARKGFAAVVAVAALVFACFTGLAYVMDTIASWNSPLVPTQLVGFSLTGGMALGALVLALAGALGDAAKGPFKMVALAVVVAGVVLAVVAFCTQIMGVSGLSNALASGADLVSEVASFVAVASVLLVASGVATVLAVRGVSPVALSSAASVLAVAGIFVARLVFYAVQLSVGLYVM